MLIIAAAESGVSRADYLPAVFGIVGVLVGALIGFMGIVLQTRAQSDQARRDELRRLYARVIEIAERRDDTREELDYFEGEQEKQELAAPSRPSQDAPIEEIEAYRAYLAEAIKLGKKTQAHRNEMILTLREQIRLHSEVVMSGSRDSVDFANVLFRVPRADFSQALTAFSVVARRDVITGRADRRKCENQIRQFEKQDWFTRVANEGASGPLSESQT